MSRFNSKSSVFLKKIMLKDPVFCLKVILQNTNNHQFPRIKILRLWLTQSISFAMEEEAKSAGKVTTTTARNEWKTAAFGNTLDHVPIRFWSTLQKPFSLQWIQHSERHWSTSSTFTETCMAAENVLETLVILSFTESCGPSENKLRLLVTAISIFFTERSAPSWITGQKC